jgi:uncharacterized integral membrane protein
MLRKIVTALILIPLAVVVIALAVANRQPVLVSFDPFDQLRPAMARALPLYQLMLLLLVVGVVIGGVAAWARQGKWRRAARLADAQARELRAEVDALRRRLAPAELASVPAPAPADQTPRLSIPPAA